MVMAVFPAAACRSVQYESGAMGIIEVDDDCVVLLFHHPAEAFGIAARLHPHSETGKHRRQGSGCLIVFGNQKCLKSHIASRRTE